MFEFDFMWLTCLIAEKIVECRSKQELRVEKKKKKNLGDKSNVHEF